jgi:hypothetical protein
LTKFDYATDQSVYNAVRSGKRRQRRSLVRLQETFSRGIDGIQASVEAVAPGIRLVSKRFYRFREA